MSNYTKLTDFAAKDSLPSGNAAKIVKGTEIDDEFEAIEQAVATKADSNNPTLTGTPLAPTATTGTSTTQVATTAFVNNSINASAGTGLEAAGGTIDISDSGVTADTYGDASNIPQITVNAQGQITSATEVAVTIPVLSHTALSTSISDGTTYDLPSNAFMLSGTSYHQMNGSTGSRLDIQIYSATAAGGTLIDTYVCGGGNENNGTDGGSGMSTRDSFTILLPANARSVKFVKGTGSASFTGNLEAAMSFTGYHS